MQPISIEIPAEIASQLKLPPKKAKRMLLEELVLRLCEQGIITCAQGASLLEMDRLRFERLLAENEIPVHGEPEDLAEDLKNLGEVL